jgi:trigger factor
VEITKFVPFSALEFTTQVAVVGDIKLPDYKKIKLAKPTVKVTDQDISEVLQSLKSRLADKQDVTRAAKDGDEVTIDFKGVDDKGEAINGAEGKAYPLILGSDSFIPGFESNLIGLKAGQNKTFTIAFPKDYGVSALASKKVTFTVDVTKVQELVEPKLDDAFAAKAGPFKTLKDLKADIKAQLTNERQTEAARQYESELIEKITKQSRLEVPDSLIDDQLESAEKEESQNLMYRGQTWEEHLKAEGVTEAEHRQRNRAPAAERVKAGLVLSEIAEQEKLDVSPQELDSRIEILKGQYQDPAMQAELDKPENRRDIAGRILTEKTIAKLVSYATN